MKVVEGLNFCLVTHHPLFPPPPQSGSATKRFGHSILNSLVVLIIRNFENWLNLPITVDVFAAGGLLLGRKSALRPNKM